MANINYNRVILGGRLTKDIELKTSGTGTVFCSFSVAVTGKNKEATYINCVAFKKTAELLNQYFHKGSSVLLEGQLSVRSYEKDGKKNYTTEVVTDSVFFVDSKGDSPAAETKKETPVTFTELDESSDLPF